MTKINPTITELEAILNSEDDRKVKINPDGTVTVEEIQKEKITLNENSKEFIEKIDKAYDDGIKQINEQFAKPMHTGPIQSQLNDGSLNGYQKAASVTAVYPGQKVFWGLMYCSLKLNGEAGEFADKVGKLQRDKGIQPFDHWQAVSVNDRQQLMLELGDILWYIANAANEIGYTLSEVADWNIQKLKDRQERNRLHGSGDNR